LGKRVLVIKNKMDKKIVVFATAIFLLSLIAVVSAFETENAVSTNVVSFSNTNSITPVYRFWNSQINSHFYTISVTERDKIIDEYPNIWVYEEIAFYAYQDQISNSVPVHRFWNKISGAHFYTIYESEKEKLINEYPHVFEYEDIAFYVFADQQANTVPVYRFWFNGSAERNSHFYTISEEERDKVINEYSQVYVSEGIAFYVFSQMQDDKFMITNLVSKERTRSSITWEWTNPTDAFDGLAVYINGEHVGNLSNNENSYKAIGLASNQAYTISVRVIKGGIISSESVSHSERTLAEGSSPSSSRPKYYITQTEHDSSSVVFTSANEPGAINLNEAVLSSNTSQSSKSIFDGINSLHYVLVAVALLCIVVLALIYKSL
jgi:hypothetical protein